MYRLSISLDISLVNVVSENLQKPPRCSQHTSGENDVDTLSRELQSRRGVVDDVSIPKEDIGSEISNALVTCPTHNPNHWRTHLKTTDWNVVLDHFADHASLILAAGHGPPPC